MAETLKSIQEKFDVASVKWICPFTKKAFDPADQKAISKHQQGVLEAARKELERERLRKQNARLKKVMVGAKTIPDFKGAFRSYVRANIPDILENDIPGLVVRKLAFYKAVASSSCNAPYWPLIEVTGMDSKKYDWSVLTAVIPPKHHLIYGKSFPSVSKRVFLNPDLVGSEIKEAIWKYQGNKHGATVTAEESYKVTMENKELVHADPEYSEFVKEYKRQSEALSKAKEDFAELQKKMLVARKRIIQKASEPPATFGFFQ